MTLSKCNYSIAFGFSLGERLRRGERERGGRERGRRGTIISGSRVLANLQVVGETKTFAIILLSIKTIRSINKGKLQILSHEWMCDNR